MMAAYASHGDTKHIVLFPANPEECFTLAVAAFDLAERFQTPVFLLSDLDIGMNDWVVPALQVGRRVPPRPRPRPQRRRAGEARPFPSLFERERRPTSPRARCPAYTPRARSSRAAPATTSSAATPRSRTNIRRSWTASLRKHRAAAQAVPEPAIRMQTDATFGVISVGGCDPAVREAVATLAERGIVADYMRIRAFPFGDDGREVPGRARSHLRRRAESRRAAQVAADAGDGRRQGQAAFRSSSTVDSRCRAGHVVDGVTSQLERS